MLDPAQFRERLEATSFPDLGAMMEGYAHAAAELAGTRFRRELDFTAESIERLDEVLVLVGESPELDLEFETRLWGSYLGEVLRLRYAGDWEMTNYPGESFAVPAVEVRGSKLFPLVKVYRRLTMGGEEDLQSFFSTVTGRLGPSAHVN